MGSVAAAADGAVVVEGVLVPFDLTEAAAVS